MKTTYWKNGQTVLSDPSNLFVYEVSVYGFYKRYFSLCNKEYFSSPVEIKNVVECFWKTPHIQICSELFAAPENWLIDNDFVIYQKPEKVKRIKSKIE